MKLLPVASDTLKLKRTPRQGPSIRQCAMRRGDRGARGERRRDSEPFGAWRLPPRACCLLCCCAAALLIDQMMRCCAAALLIAQSRASVRRLRVLLT